MGMFDGLGDLSGAKKLPVGTGYKADVVGVFRDEDKGTVNISFQFRDFNTRLSERHFLRKKDGTANEVGASILAKQMRNAGYEVKNGPQLNAALAQLEGTPVLVDVGNKKNSDFQTFYISGKGVRDRGADVADAIVDDPDGGDDDLPF